jgi:hypothetical protein
MGLTETTTGYARLVQLLRDEIGRPACGCTLGEREPGWFNVLALAEAVGVDCTAFTQEPAARPPSGPGRPRKAPEEAPAPKRPRGRPRRPKPGHHAE